MGPTRYWSKDMQMSADLKAVAKRVLKARPEMFVTRNRNETSMDGDGRVTITVVKEAKATALTPAARHALATRRE